MYGIFEEIKTAQEQVLVKILQCYGEKHVFYGSMGRIEFVNVLFLFKLQT